MMALYAGIDGVVRELTEVDVGDDGVVKPMKEMWAGVDGVQRQIFSRSTKLSEGMNLGGQNQSKADS